MIVLGATLKSVMERSSLKWISSCHVKATMSAFTSDAWSNVSNEPVINYMAVSPNNSLFLEAVNTDEQGHTAAWPSKDLI